MTPFGERLAERIRRDGPIGVDCYMAECVAHYYAARDPLGSAGDFVTAPEISQMFGELIGLWAADLAARAGGGAVDLVELGPGRGSLMADALRAARAAGMAVGGVHLVETSAALRRLQAAAVPDAVWHDDLATLPATRPVIVIANEFFDALPVAQQVEVGGVWQERRVALVDGGLAFVPAGETIREASPARAAVMTELAGRIARQGGAALIVDYGYGLPTPTGDTLQAMRAHARVDPLAHPGEADLTADVDFAALAVAAAAAGARVHRLATQGDFLVALGIEARAARLQRDLDADGRHAIAGAMRRLVMPQAMGSLFKVLAITHPDWPQPAGLPQ